MKNLYILFFALMAFGTSSCAAPHISGENNYHSYNYGEAFIFVERGVEFAVYPDGQFDFYFNPNNRRHTTIVAPGFNMTFNSGYNYAPFVQYDDCLLYTSPSPRDGL